MIKEMSGAEMVIEALSDQGVQHLFGYPGGAVLPIYDELFKQKNIKHILVRHEQGAVHAAEGYARSTGKVGCVLVTSCEPFPMCLASALWARVDRVLFAADRDDAADAGFDDRAFYDVFEDPRTESPTPVERVAVPNRNQAFDACRAKPDRVEY